MEKLGVPTVVVGTTPFVKLAEAGAEAGGLVGLRLVVLPHPMNILRLPELAARQKGAMDSIISLLTEVV